VTSFWGGGGRGGGQESGEEERENIHSILMLKRICVYSHKCSAH